MLAPAISSFAISLLIVLTSKWHGRHSYDTNEGVQKFHTSPTPRIGGLAMFPALIVAALLLPQASGALLNSLIIAAIPAFSAGLIEDFTKKVSVRNRLLATMVSGLCAWWLTGYSLNRIEVIGIDVLLAWLPVSVSFTTFAVAGIANATNIIDGFNGLASGTVMICFGAFAMIAAEVGDLVLMQLCIALIIVIAGFFLLNFPFGKLFMGDGGAYLLGFLLAWVAVMLPMRNAGISKWSSLLVCSYPIIETLFSMARRYWNKSHPGQPDSEHLHSLIKVKLVRRYFHFLPQSLRNGLVSPFCWIFAVATSSIAVMHYGSKPVLITAGVAALVLYAAVHGLLMRSGSGRDAGAGSHAPLTGD
ncbi:MAG: glycosyl transferase [Pelodictyon luteolum]|uniref:Glycosyl transferase n=1 Tax=Pelodictyon luteolum TaxID=1100 RepID=A0A165MB47_PELLU|nr:glycosyltransferase [Pelodictyon luteolum]KZK75034.1 MAG: glycosyl transferase [Pelodictyon luteolum]